MIRLFGLSFFGDGIFELAYFLLNLFLVIGNGPIKSVTFISPVLLFFLWLIVLKGNDIFLISTFLLSIVFLLKCNGIIYKVAFLLSVCFIYGQFFDIFVLINLILLYALLIYARLLNFIDFIDLTETILIRHWAVAYFMIDQIRENYGFNDQDSHNPSTLGWVLIPLLILSNMIVLIIRIIINIEFPLFLVLPACRVFSFHH